MGLKYHITRGAGPLVGAAIHQGHFIRPGLLGCLNLSEAERFREEDPFTGYLTEVVPSRVLVTTSRFEVDLNRPPDDAVYLSPEDAWGLKVWKENLSENEIEISRANHREFYTEIHGFFQELINRYGYLVVLDIHSYNHRKMGLVDVSEFDRENPEVNLGTGTLNNDIWSPLKDAFIQRLREYNFRGRNLDVRENVKFKGGYFSKWTHANFPERSCVLAIEFRKTFMDEWTGALNQDYLVELRQALGFAVDKLHEIASEIHETKLIMK